MRPASSLSMKGAATASGAPTVPIRRKQQRVEAVGAGLDDVIDGAGAGALRVHAPAGVVPPQPYEHLQYRWVSGDVSAGSSLKTRDSAGARRLGRYLIVLELHAGIVIGFEILRHAGQDVTLRRSLPPAGYCVEARGVANRASAGRYRDDRNPAVLGGIHSARLRRCCYPN